MHRNASCELLGSVRPRKLVVAAVIRRAGRILVSQRRHDQPMPHFWEFPGGKVEAGEAPTEALAREIREELGCEVVVGAIYEVVFHRYPDFDLYLLVYACELPAGATPEPKAVARVAWVAPRDLPGLGLLPADLPLAERLAAEAS